MKYIRGLARTLALLLIAACTHDVDVAPATIPSGPYADASKIPGKFALLVDTTHIDENASIDTDTNCNLHSFPMRAIPAFKTSTGQAVQRAFEAIDVVSAPLNPVQLRQQGYRGLITVHAGRLATRIILYRGFFVATATGIASLTIDVEIDGPDSRLFETSIATEQKVDEDTYGGCDTAADAASKATTAAIQYTMQELTKQVATASKLRLTTAAPTSN